VARVSILLIMVALIAGMVGCGGVIKYNLTIFSTTGGSVISPGEGTFTYDEGTVVNLTAEADEGYYFVNWTGDVGTIANVNATITTITMNGDYETTANFEQIPPGQFALTIYSTSGGSVTVPGEATFTYDEGMVVDLVATPDAGYHFVNWTGDVYTMADINAGSTAITMRGDYEISANFAIDTHALTTNSTAGGSVAEPGEGTYAYDYGTVVSLVAEAEEGYHFVNWTGDVGTIGNVDSRITTVMMHDDYSITANFGVNSIPMVAAGGYHTVGLKFDGTVVAVGHSDSYSGVGNWTNIVQIAAGSWHTVGVKADGTVVAVGDNEPGGCCDVGNWTDIVQVAAGGGHTVGVKSDGTAVAVGLNNYGQCDVSDWTDISQVRAGGYYTVGVRTDGTVVAVGRNDSNQCYVSGWTNIVQVDAGLWHTLGVKSDGTVVAVGLNNYGQCDVTYWTNITQVAAGSYYTVGTKSDGKAVATGWNGYGQCNVGGWTDIIQVAAGGSYTVGLRTDGTVVAVGENNFGQCDVGGWDLN